MADTVDTAVDTLLILHQTDEIEDRDTKKYIMMQHSFYLKELDSMLNDVSNELHIHCDIMIGKGVLLKVASPIKLRSTIIPIINHTVRYAFTAATRLCPIPGSICVHNMKETTTKRNNQDPIDWMHIVLRNLSVDYSVTTPSPPKVMGKPIT